jgi:hypothetical protein
MRLARDGAENGIRNQPEETPAMASFDTGQVHRLLARFVLRQSAGGHSGRMPLPAGNYTIETRVVGEDLEVLMFECAETPSTVLRA